ncbi:F-box protein At4g09920-like isoform X1 [Quercus robur]|uniref:F-box protein At4g09920-like isoform X1 n=1 Tax=Quercus robur TaxID=38942 RepID=UPI002163B381|nr:F-box protein At4g09920-like isoform X1 [Quercus robur]
MDKTVLPIMDKTVLPSDKSIEDRISQLPDEMLISVLSFLMPKEAFRTSVLSHRWKCLCPFLPRSLDFDGLYTMWEIEREKKSLQFERKKFLQWVNDTLKSCRVSTIDEFRVCFELDDGSKSHVDGWIDFAISKGVKRLELDFTARSPFKDASNFYRFPNESFTSDKTCIKSLTSLTLKYIRVTGELLEHFLSNCPLLERLHVDNSEDLVNLKIYGSSLKLKYLHIIRCLEFKSIEINAPNLESFGYVGNEIRLHVHSAPRLLDVRIGGMYSHPIYYAFGSLSSYLYQLESLTLDVHSYTYNGVEFPEFQTLTKLKHLKVTVATNEGSSLLGLIPLIEAAPFLHKFVFELILSKINFPKKARKVKKYPNEHLKEVEIVGFAGRAIDIQLVVYLLESAINLEKIIVNPYAPYIVGIPRPENVRTTVKFEGAREAAKRLKEKQLTRAEFVIM